MSTKGQHVRKSEDHKKYSSNSFWDKKEKEWTVEEKDDNLSTQPKKEKKHGS